MLTIAALLLAGCQQEECTTFAGTEVSNPDGKAPAGYIEEVDALIDNFALWTSRGTVCVDEVELVPTCGDWCAGRYHADTWIHEYRFEGWIAVDYHSSSGYLPTVVYHEYCHAVDHYEGSTEDHQGYVSETRPDLFPSDKPWEDLASICGAGPQSTSFMNALEAACGMDLGGEPQRFVNDLVYPAAELPEDRSEGTLPISLTRRVVRGLREYWPFAAEVGGPAVYLLASVPGSFYENGFPQEELLRIDARTAQVIGLALRGSIGVS